MKLFVFVLLLHSVCFAKAKNKPVETPQQETVQKAIVLILDKLYTNRNFHEVEIGHSIVISDMKVTILDCIRNSKGQNFMFMHIQENDDDILNEWVSITEYSSTPTPHKRFEVIPISCNFYNPR